MPDSYIQYVVIMSTSQQHFVSHFILNICKRTSNISVLSLKKQTNMHFILRKDSTFHLNHGIKGDMFFVLEVGHIQCCFCSLLILLCMLLFSFILISFFLYFFSLSLLISQKVHATCHTPTLMYRDGCVSNSVFWYDHTVTVFLPLWRLVLNIGDGDGQLH